MASLQQQIDFIQKEHDQCKLVYDCLLREFGDKHVHLVDREICEELYFFHAAIQSLRELENLKAQKHGDER